VNAPEDDAMPESTSRQPAPKGATAVVRDHASAVRGTVRIAPAVLIELIELTVDGIDGIAGLRGLREKPDAAGTEGARTWDNGKVAVTVQGDQIDAALALAMYRGTNVSGLSAEVQRQIGFAAGHMLGMTVRTVDMYIEEIVPGPEST
jgi:uncharacterized alkaline shock family protein YloU